MLRVNIVLIVLERTLTRVLFRCTIYHLLSPGIVMLPSFTRVEMDGHFGALVPNPGTRVRSTSGPTSAMKTVAGDKPQTLAEDLSTPPKYRLKLPIEQLPDLLYLS